MPTKIFIEHLIQLIISTRDSTEEDVIDARNAAISWFIAHDGFRSKAIKITDAGIADALGVLVQFQEHQFEEAPRDPEAA